MSGKEREALTAEQRASLEAAWVKAKRSNWPGEYDGFEAGYRAALSAREEPPRKGAIMCIGTAIDGKADGWAFDRPEVAYFRGSDGTELWGGWSMEELELIAASRNTVSPGEFGAREDIKRPDDEMPNEDELEEALLNAVRENMAIPVRDTEQEHER